MQRHWVSKWGWKKWCQCTCLMQDCHKPLICKKKKKQNHYLWSTMNCNKDVEWLYLFLRLKEIRGGFLLLCSHYVNVSVVQSPSRVQLFVTPWTAAPRLLCSPLSPRVCSDSRPLSQWCYLTSSSLSFCLQSFPASRSFPVSQLFELGAKYWSFSFSVSHSNEYWGLIPFRMDWLDLLAVQGTLKSLLQHHNWKIPILWCSAFFMVQLLHLYITTD